MTMQILLNTVHTRLSRAITMTSECTCYTNPCVASGGGNLPQTRFSHQYTKTAWNFSERFRDFS